MQCGRNSSCEKQWIISLRKRWTALLNAKNRFYECSKQIEICSKHDGQTANFNNVETNFINEEK